MAKPLSLRNFDELFKMLIDLTRQEPELPASKIAEELEAHRQSLPEAREMRITAGSVRDQWRYHGGRNAFIRVMRCRVKYGAPLTANADCAI